MEKIKEEAINYIEYKTLCPLPPEYIEQMQVLEINEEISLDLSNQGLEDISFLANYKNLKVLSLRRNKIKDISVLAQLEHLEELDLSYNQIEDFSPLENLKHLYKIAPQKLNKYVTEPALGPEITLQFEKTAKHWYKDIKNPRIQKTGFIFKKTSVTWDCITFGSYPQERVSPMKKQVKEKLVEDTNGDLLYKEENSSGDVKKYRKLSRSYFKYQPIRWRVLDIKDGIAVLFADVILDTVPYQNIVTKGVTATWESSSICQWLNGSEADSFYQLAFSAEEREAIVKETDLGVHLLKFPVLSEYKYASYGFGDLYVKGKLLIDGLQTKGFSDYAEAKNLCVSKKRLSNGIMAGTGSWWLETFVSGKNCAYVVMDSGRVMSYGVDVTAKAVGVRPVIMVDLSKVDEKEIQITAVSV